MSAVRPTIQLTTGLPGSHKTFARGVMFVLWWLGQAEEHEKLGHAWGKHISNFPLDVEAFKEYLRAQGREAALVDRYVRVLTHGEMENWKTIERKGKAAVAAGGPWSLFSIEEMQGAHLAIDECHEIIPKSGQIETRYAWRNFLSQVRHYQMTVEFITQVPERMDEIIRGMAEMRMSIVNSELRRDPFLRIPMGEWYELRAAFTGKYTPCVFEIERRKVDGKDVVTGDPRRYWPDASYYALYNSYSKPGQAGQGKAGKGVLREYQKRGRLGVCWWFGRRHFWRVVLLGAFLSVCCWVFFGGGMGVVLAKWLEMSTGVVSPKAAAVEQKEFSRSADPGLPAESSSSAAAEFLKTDFQGQGEVTYSQEQAAAAILEGQEAVGEVEALRAQLEALREADVKQREEVLRLYNDAVVVVGLTPELVIMADGGSYGVGEALEGLYKGEKIGAIDYVGRKVVLDSGRVLRLAGVRGSSAAVTGAAVDGGTGLDGGLRGGVGSQEGGEDGGGIGGEDYDSGGSNASSGVPAASGNESGRVGRVGRQAGQPDRFSRSAGDNNSGDHGDGSAAPGGGSDRREWLVLPRATDGSRQGLNGSSGDSSRRRSFEAGRGSRSE